MSGHVHLPGDSGGVITIVSTREPDRDPVCALHWRGEEWVADVEEIRQTAIDLVSCAAYAEWTQLLIAKMGLPPAVVTEILLDLMRAGGRTTDHGNAATVWAYPGSGTVKATRERQPKVIVRRGTRNGMLTPGEARQMAADWLIAAEATESDQLLAEAYRSTHPGAGGLDRLFRYLRVLRDRRHLPPEATT